MAMPAERLEDLARRAWGEGVRAIDPARRTVTVDMDVVRAWLDAGHGSDRQRGILETVRFFLRDNPGRAPGDPYPAPSGMQFLFEGEKLDYLPAPDLEAIADGLIGELGDFEHLRDKRVLYLWKREGGKRHGQPVLGKCAKPSGFAKHYTAAAWIIWIASDWVNFFHLTRHQVEAALYHELLHAGEEIDADGNKTPVVFGHDAEMFAAEVRRYGLWKEDLRLVSDAFKQLPLFDLRGGSAAPVAAPQEVASEGI